MEHNLRGLFITAACQGNVTALKNLAANLKFDEHVTTSEGCNALHSAAYHGQTEACRFLIEGMKFDVNRADNMGDTPLFQAIWKGHWSTAKYLIERGADVTRSNSKDSTPLHYAARKGSEDFVQLLLSRGADLHATSQSGEVLHSAATHGNAAVLKFLLDRNANPNSISPLNDSPLLLSMQAGSIECMELLLKGGADPDHAPELSKTPLCYAASKPNEQMIQCLLKYNANPNKLHKGKKALEYAAMVNCRQVVKLLYPQTYPIASYTDWSISGIMQHAQLEQAKQKELCLEEKEKGNQAVARKDYGKAIYCYTSAIEADSTDAEVLKKLLSNRSLCFARSNLAVLAWDDAKACIKLDPGWSKGHYRLGAALSLLEDYGKAAEAFARASELDPDNEEIEKAQSAAEDAFYH